MRQLRFGLAALPDFGNDPRFKVFVQVLELLFSAFAVTYLTGKRFRLIAQCSFRRALMCDVSVNSDPFNDVAR